MADLIDHIARRLGTSTDEAERQYREAAAWLLAEIREADAASIPGLGRLVRRDDEVCFEPEPRLVTVVNHRFAGLYPIPVEREAKGALDFEAAFAVPDIPVAPGLAGGTRQTAQEFADEASARHAAESADETSARSEAGTLQSADDVEPLIYAPGDEETLSAKESTAGWESTDDVLDFVRQEVESNDVTEESAGEARSFGPGESTPAARAASAEEPVARQTAWNRPSRFSEPEAPNHEVDDDYLAESEFARDAAEAVDFGGSLLRSPAAAEAPDGEPEEERASSEPADESAAAEESVPPEPSPTGPQAPVIVRKSGISRLYWLLIPVLVVAIGAVLWLLRQSEREPQQPRQSAVPMVADSVTSTDRTEETLTGQGSEPSAADLDSGAVPATRSESGPASAGVGVGASADRWEPGSIDRRRGGYTLVVSSQATRNEAIAFARNVVADLRDESLPVDVFEGTADGRSRYRVGVGQFGTVEKALSEMDRLGSRLPRGVWVLRIRNTM